MENVQKDKWDKLKISSAFVAAVLVPIVIAFAGNEYSSAIKESENRLRYTELAIEILTEKPTSTNQNIRGWAVDVINKYSDVPIDEKTKKEMLESPIVEVEKFMAAQWAPIFIDSLIDQPAISKAWNEVAKTGSKEEQAEFLKIILKKAMEKVFEKRKELLIEGIPDTTE